MRTALLACVLMTAVAAAGCGLEPGSGQCREAAIDADPVTITDPLAPLTVTTRLTYEREPIPDAEISIATLTTGTPNLPEGARGGRHIGDAMTDADGVARFVREEGIDGLLLPEEQLIGFQADFTPLEKIDDVQYCRVRIDIAVTI